MRPAEFRHPGKQHVTSPSGASAPRPETDPALRPGGARYDAIVDWYIEESARWGVGYVSPVPGAVDGTRVLELACGPGRAARLLAQRGASVTAVDISEGLIAHGRALEAAEPVGVRYIVGDATSTAWWDGMPFDGAVCEMALMDIDDLAGVARTAGAALRAGAWFAFSIFHPCFPGGAGSASGLPSWHPDRGYSWEGWWSFGNVGIRGRVGANHRKLSTYLNTFVAGGFRLEFVAEPDFPVPRFLGARFRRDPAAGEGASRAL